jgi:hypothetical protein
MKSKIMLVTLCAAFLMSGTVYGAGCPPIPEKDWDGKTLKQTGPTGVEWHVGKITPDINLAEIKWKAYHAWILPENKKQFLKYGYFQCVYEAIDPTTENKVKVTIASQPVPETNPPSEAKTLAENSEFAGGAGVNNDYTSGVKKGAKCAPSNAEANNQFPPECDIIPRK